jgi:hypothetical protein
LATLILLWLVGIGLVIWGVVDATSRPDWAWQQSGQSKGLWIALPIVLWLFCGIIGGILSVVYLVSIRPQVMAAEGRGGPYGGGGSYGGPPSGYGGPPPSPYSSPSPPPPPPSNPPSDPFG